MTSPQPVMSLALARFNSQIAGGNTEKRWLEGLYLDQPVEWDDPYRFFGW